MKKHYTVSNYLFVLEILCLVYGLLCFLDVNMNNLSSGIVSAWNFLRFIYF